MRAQFCVRLPARLHERLRRVAERSGSTPSRVVLHAIQRYLLDAERQTPRPRPYDLAKNLIGSVRSGGPDRESRRGGLAGLRIRRGGRGPRGAPSRA